MKNKVFFPALLLGIILVLCGTDARAGEHKVLLVHSYHAEYKWCRAITAGVKKALAGRSIRLDIVYMDTKRQPSFVWKKIAGRTAQEKIDTWQPDVVIAADDNAQVFVTRKYLDGKPWFVFCGVNGNPDDYGLPASNVTGIVERPHFHDSITFLKRIYPGIRRIAVISDRSITSTTSLDYISDQSVDVKVLDLRSIDTFSLWQKRIKQYNTDADALCIYTYHTVQAAQNTVMEPSRLMKWTIQNCTIPTVGFFDFGIQDGLLCGVVESGIEHGYEAGCMALALLDGADIATLPVRTAKKGVTMLNSSTASALGISVPPELVQKIDKMVQ